MRACCDEASPPSGPGLLLECLGLLQKRQGLGQASGERIGIPQVGHHSGEKEVHLAGLADVETLGQQGNGVGEVAAQQVEIARAPQGNGQTEDVMRGLGDVDRLTAIDESLRKRAQLRQAPGHRGPGTRGTRAQSIEELREQVVRERGNNVTTDVHRLPIVATLAIDPCEGKARAELQGNVVEARGQGEGALADVESTRRVAHVEKMGDQMAVGQSQALLIVPGFRQGDGFLQEGKDTRKGSQAQESHAQVKPEIDGLRAPLRAVGEVL